MRRYAVMTIAAVFAALSTFAHADQASESALDARVKALEQRVAELEARLKAPPPAGPAGMPAASAAPAPVAVAVVAPPRWKDKDNWTAIKIGLGWSQVKALLGPAGRVSTGVFGDVWYYPDDSGGRVVFDRDGRVSDWNPPQGH